MPPEGWGEGLVIILIPMNMGGWKSRPAGLWAQGRGPRGGKGGGGTRVEVASIVLLEH